MSADQKEDLLNFSFYADYLSHKKTKFISQHEREGLALVANGDAVPFSFDSFSSPKETDSDSIYVEENASGSYASDVDTSLILKQIVENSPDLIFSVNVDFELISANLSCLNAFKSVFGIDLSVGQSLLDQLSEYKDDQNDIYKILSRSMHEESLSIDMSLSKTNSISPLYSAQFSRMRNAAGVVIGVSCIFRDINDRALRADRLESLAQIDSVTRALNSREFKVQLDQRIAACRRGDLSESILLYIAVNGLDRIRSECGYNAVDRCLLKISMRLRRELNKSDLLARVSDNNFSVLLSENREEKYIVVAKLLHDAVSQTSFKWKGRSYKLESAIGLTKVHGKTIDSVSAMETADLACEIAGDAKSPLFLNRHS